MKDLGKILKDLNITQQEVADKLNVKSLSTINLKINGKANFTTKQARLLRDLINSKKNTNFTLEDLFDDTTISDSVTDN